MSGSKPLSARMRVVKYYAGGDNGKLYTARFKSDRGIEKFLQDRKGDIQVVEIKK